MSYLTARPARDVIVAAYQEIARGGGATLLTGFSRRPVVAEAGAGDPEAARRRLEALESVAFLDATPEAENLAHSLIEAGAAPRQAADDAAHIAIAAANGIDFPVTWNFQHIANTAMCTSIQQVCCTTIKTGAKPSNERGVGS